MRGTLHSLGDISINHSWADIRQFTSKKLNSYEEKVLKEKILDNLHKSLNLFDYKWLLKRLSPQRMTTIKRLFQLEALISPNVFYFIDIIVKTFGKQNAVSNLCLALGASSLYHAVKAQSKKNFSYSALVDFILLVFFLLLERSQRCTRLSNRQ